ncbi:MarR family transcriptional regulator [Flavobacteriaceae bacterium]|nr:MarR family transcriptional regulator [Flavobacteriaceae bacterium]
MVEKLNVFFKTYDLTVQQYNILRILRGQQGKAINLYVLQKHMIHKMSNTTRLIEKLRIKELVNREPCPVNRRKVEITITNKGLGLLDGIEVAIKDFELALVKPLTVEELTTMNSLLEKIREHNN